jgi:predicted ABC-type ATPase
VRAQDGFRKFNRFFDYRHFIRLFFIATDHPSINAARIAHRVMEGGHDVPIAKIISRRTKSIANCAKAIEFADRAYIYDNSIDNADPKLLFRTSEGRRVKCYRAIHEWAKSILPEA